MPGCARKEKNSSFHSEYGTMEALLFVLLHSLDSSHGYLDSHIFVRLQKLANPTTAQKKTVEPMLFCADSWLFLLLLRLQSYLSIYLAG